MANLIAFIDSGATECFVSKWFVEENRLGTKMLIIPKLLTNADGTNNKASKITHYTELKVSIGGDEHTLYFYIADMGGDHIVLGYPWFVASNLRPNWKEGTLAATVSVRTSGAA